MSARAIVAPGSSGSLSTSSTKLTVSVVPSLQVYVHACVSSLIRDASSSAARARGSVNDHGMTSP